MATPPLMLGGQADQTETKTTTQISAWIPPDRNVGPDRPNRDDVQWASEQLCEICLEELGQPTIAWAMVCTNRHAVHVACIQDYVRGRRTDRRNRVTRNENVPCYMGRACGRDLLAPFQFRHFSDGPLPPAPPAQAAQPAQPAAAAGGFSFARPAQPAQPAQPAAAAGGFSFAEAAANWERDRGCEARLAIAVRDRDRYQQERDALQQLAARLRAERDAAITERDREHGRAADLERVLDATRQSRNDLRGALDVTTQSQDALRDAVARLTDTVRDMQQSSDRLREELGECRDRSKETQTRLEKEAARRHAQYEECGQKLQAADDTEQALRRSQRQLDEQLESLRQQLQECDLRLAAATPAYSEFDREGGSQF